MLQRNIDHSSAGSSHEITLPAYAWPTQPREEVELLPAALRVLRRHIRVIAITTLIGLLLTGAVVMSMTSQYKGTVVVYVDPRRTQLFKDRDIVGLPGPGTDSGLVDSQIELMKSPQLLRQLAEKLDLKNDPEFTQPSILGQIKGLVLLPVKLLIGTSPNTDDPLAGIIDTLSRKIDPKRRNLTFVIELNAWSQEAAKAVRLANTLSDLYLEDQARAKTGMAGRANKYLDEQVEELRKRVAASEQAYENYRAKFGLYDAGGESLSNRQMGQLNDQLAGARGRLAEARGRYEELKKINPKTVRTAASLPDVLKSTVVAGLRAQYADVARHRAELVARYGPLHPQVPAIQAQVDDLAGQITQEINRIVGGARVDYEAAVSQEQSLQQTLDKLKNDTAEYNQAAVRLHELERDAQVNRDMFQAFLARAKDSAAQAGADIPDSRVVAVATTPPMPGFPPRLLLIGLGLFLSAGLGVGLAFTFDALREGLRTVDEVDDKLGLHPIIPIPAIEEPVRLPFAKAPPLGDLRWLHATPIDEEGRGTSASRARARAARFAGIALDEPESGFAEGIRTLRFTVKRAAAERDMNVVLVTSALPGEGKSTISINLARAAAADSRVLLIDADLRHPSLGHALGLPTPYGIADIISGQCELQDALRKDERTGLFVIGGAHRLHGADALALLGSAEMDALLAFSRNCFDLVIIDSAPLLPIADTRVLTELVDGVVLVIASEQTATDAVASTLRENPIIRERLVGVALNRAPDQYDRYYRERDKETRRITARTVAGDGHGE